jgi:hypothetical protein
MWNYTVFPLALILALTSLKVENASHSLTKRNNKSKSRSNPYFGGRRLKQRKLKSKNNKQTQYSMMKLEKTVAKARGNFSVELQDLNSLETNYLYCSTCRRRQLISPWSLYELHQTYNLE